ncbi:MMPL family transporter [Pseudomonas sp. BN102]|uniref:efflux RND transporter permease subunit n=1 Tax=Pseudomonas sp. BN102 TaxID=2567886 RepID=UPI0024556BB4|nr:MMPL family transporter [Pseudomonas sp. BN102]MDH4609259.1 RND family transporter [Pseudomonas sp. BN102]
MLSNNKTAAAPGLDTTASPFDRSSGAFHERLFFNNRILFLLVGLFVTLSFGFQSAKLGVNASFEKMMPSSHEYIQNYRAFANNLRSLGNAVTVVVENKNGSIYDAGYQKTLSELNDRVFLINGVDRAFVQSLWMASVRWTAVTAEGFDGGPVMPPDYDGSPKSIEQLRANVEKAGLKGSLVAMDERSSAMFVPLMERDPVTGQLLDYKAFTDSINAINTEFQSRGVELHVIGFAKLVGDLISGLMEVLSYFVVAAAVVSVIVYWYSRCLTSTFVVVGTSLIGVIWQLGIMQLFGFVLDPFSVLVPFLVFAIGVSHGSQMMSGIIQDIGEGADRYVAARLTYRRLCLAGFVALVADALGFAVISVIDIPAIRDLALQATVGVAALIITNLLLIPVVLSFTGISARAAQRASRVQHGEHFMVRWLGDLAEKRIARLVLIIVAIITTASFIHGQKISIGDSGAGASELRADSIYNKDVNYIRENYGLSKDMFAVIVTTPEGGLGNFETLLQIDRLEQQLGDLPGVQITESAASIARRLTPAGFEGSPKWYTISRSRYITNDAVDNVFTARPGLINDSRTVAPIIVYLSNHNAETLQRLTKVVEAFAAENNNEDRKFLLAGGNAGVEAATNQAVEKASFEMEVLVYAAVILLCWITFRSWRAVLVAILPLIVVTILSKSLMVLLGIGLKVATLPVVALGVGIGVDYALYMLTVFLAFQRQGMSVKGAYTSALASTGQVVLLVGVTLTAAVGTWIWSPIKFQADMGLLLAFMFLGNMLAALIMVPALSAYLLAPKKVVPQDSVGVESDNDSATKRVAQMSAV